jgi:hypothetical protein
MHIPRGTYLYNYGTVYTTFLLSGATHAYGAYFAGLAVGSPAAVTRESVRQNLTFFIMHSSGIWLEENVPMLLRALGLIGKATPKGETPVMWKRLLGYAWTVVYLGWTTRAWLNNSIVNGVFVEDGPPLGIGKRLWSVLGVIDA